MSHFLLFCDVRHQVVYVVYTAVKQEGRRRENENVYINTYMMVHVLFNQSDPPPTRGKCGTQKKQLQPGDYKLVGKVEDS